MKALGKGSVASIVRVGLTIAWVVLWVALTVLVVAAASYAAFLVLTTTGAIDGPLPVPAETTVTWHVAAPALLIGAVVIGGALIIVDRLRSLFESFTTGEPFRRENANHLRVIWITMLIMEVSRYVLLAILGALYAAVGLPEGASADFNVSVDLSNWMSILILIVLAEVFREGARLKEEQELTI